MAYEPLRKRPVPEPKPRPKIWAEGDQRPAFNLRAFGRAGLFLSREAVAPLHAWAARTARRVAINVKNGAGRIPEEKLGRVARFVPSHLRVAGWIKNGAAILSHASATADPDVKRGNALVIEIEPHLWPEAGTGTEAGTAPTGVAPGPAPAPVVLPEPEPAPPVENPPMEDPLAAIRAEIADPVAAGQPRKAGKSAPGARRWTQDQASAAPPAAPPAPPGEIATGAIQVFGFMIGWLSSFAALPYGLGKATWLHIKGVDLRGVGLDD